MKMMRLCSLHSVNSLRLEAFRHNLGSNIGNTIEETPALDRRLELVTSKVFFSLNFHEGHSLNH